MTYVGPSKGHHPLTELIPMRAKQDDLVMAAAQGAVLEQVYLYENKIIEGRVRHAALREYGQQPQLKDWVLVADGHPLDWMVRKHVKDHRPLTELEAVRLVANVLSHYREMQGQTERLLYDALGKSLSWNKIRALLWLDEAGALGPVVSGEKEIYEAARALGLAPETRDLALGKSYGAGDKFDEATLPLERYLKAWKRKRFEYRHVPPKEASRRISSIDQLLDGLQAARADLQKRAVEATFSAPPERRRKE